MSTSRAESLGPLALSRAASSDAPIARARLLESITGPAQVRDLSVAELEQLAKEVRQRIIEVIADKGGHFGAPLGAVDLTIALMKELDLAQDRVVWDVGHQAYAWKILTGRNQRFDTIRQYRGLSGFLKRKESGHDAFGAGHASTSLAAALGMAEARDALGKDNRVVAVIGDGAMTGGMAYEALNNAGLRKTRMLVIVNDNEMSISENVWVVQKLFRKTVTHPVYYRLRDSVASMVKRHSPPGFVDWAHRVEESMKGVIVPGMFFEELGFRYIGPVDGHNMWQLVETLASIKDLPGPICLHVITQKGKGYRFAEDDPIKYHAAANMKIETGVMKKSSGPPAYTKVFSDTMLRLAEKDSRIVAITAAMDNGTGLDAFSRKFPGRFFDVGIAEECAVTMAAGMAAEGLRPVCAIYSTFLQRAFDQIIHDVALQDLPVIFALDRAGLVGADGPTHHGVFDLSYLRMVPNMVVMAPRDEPQLRDMLALAVAHEEGPIAVRYPRGAGPGLPYDGEPQPITIGHGETLQRGQRAALVGIGAMVPVMHQAARLLGERLGHKVTVIDARFVKPLDRELLLEAASSHEFLFTAEDNQLMGGFGSAVNELLAAEGAGKVARCFGLPDRFIDHGTVEQLYLEVGLTAPQIAEAIAGKLGA